MKNRAPDRVFTKESPARNSRINKLWTILQGELLKSHCLQKLGKVLKIFWLGHSQPVPGGRVRPRPCRLFGRIFPSGFRRTAQKPLQAGILGEAASLGSTPQELFLRAGQLWFAGCPSWPKPSINRSGSTLTIGVFVLSSPDDWSGRGCSSFVLDGVDD